MIKILNTKQVKELDVFTISKEGIPSIDLMERACRAFVNWFIQRVDANQKIGIVCGTGNNGGDGLGVARILHDWGYPVKVWIVRGLVPESPDFKINLERVRSKLDVYEIISESDRGLFADRDVLIDAIFGSGLSRPVEGIYAQAIRCMNDTNAIRIAIDIPSGLLADQPSTGDIINALHTVSFQLPKLAFMFPENYKYSGEWDTVDIGLNKEFIKQAKTSNFLLTIKGIRKILKVRSKFDHKGNFGHGLMITGSYGKMGAAVLSAHAAMRAGIGLLTVHIPKCGYSIMQTAVPEAMVSVDKDDHLFTDIFELGKYNVMGIGPGIGQEELTVNAFRTVLQNFKKPMVIDADALNILASHPDFQSLIPENSILTPHPREFERLAGKWGNEFERLEKQKQLAENLRSVIILKGANSSIVTPDGRVFFNSTGNPGMATGGTGDVLTGILTGLLAQAYSSENAALIGVFLHGLAGDQAAKEKGMNSLIASDLVEFLPQAFRKLTYS